jgi:hypothetical protein
MKHLNNFNQKNEISYIIDFLEKEYPIKKGTINIGGNREVSYIIIDDKPYYLEGFTQNKTYIRRKLFWEVKEHFQDSETTTINKAIKIYFMYI